MAAAAVGAKFSIVDVVGAMTVAATPIDRFDLVQRHAVTVVTADLNMGSVDAEIGLQVVIESP